MAHDQPQIRDRCQPSRDTAAERDSLGEVIDAPEVAVASEITGGRCPSERVCSQAADHRRFQPTVATRNGRTNRDMAAVSCGQILQQYFAYQRQLVRVLVAVNKVRSPAKQPFKALNLTPDFAAEGGSIADTEGVGTHDELRHAVALVCCLAFT